MDSYIKGKYKSDIFRSEKGYVIGIFKITETNIDDLIEFINHTITITGYFYNLNENDNYILFGDVVNHPKYGIQFSVSESETIKPTDKDGIIEFLSSDLFPGVGEKLATKIVDTLGENTIDLILDDKSNLFNIPKISNKTAEKIYNIMATYENSHKTIVYLCDIGFNSSEALLIYNTYRNNTLDRLNENIYEFNEINDISFLKVDRIREKLEIKNDDQRRIKACILYIMKYITYQNGDTYLSFDLIYNEVLKYLNIGIPESDFASYLEELSKSNKIVIDNDKYYLKEIFSSEVNISGRIKEIIKNNKKYKKLNDYLEEIEVYNNIKYNFKQKEAIKSSLINGATIITGGPGTGKTTIIKAIILLYQTLNKLNDSELINEVLLLAPTGRASKRLAEATNIGAMTIHRFLKWHKESNSFEINEYNKDFTKKFIVVDEASMIDINLFDSLLKGLGKDIQLVLVGDYNQLPSVGPGMLLKDLIDSQIANTIYLDLLYRQSNKSFIPILADNIKNGVTDNILGKVNDYVFLECNRFNIRSNIKKICEQLLEKGVSLTNLQLLAPMYKSMNGIDNLNRDLQDIFNPYQNQKEISVGEFKYRVGDKVIELVNMPDENIYNGDIGYITDIILSNESESKKNEIIVNFDGNFVKFLPKDYNKIKLAYIISIHKSQGSEFDIVIMPLSLEYNKMLYRKLIYTGVTRAKSKLILIGELEAFKYSINNTNEYLRKTSLLNRLIS